MQSFYTQPFQMNKLSEVFVNVVAVFTLAASLSGLAGEPPKVPRFSVDHMDKTVDPGRDFFSYACGTWVKSNPIPADKSRWAAFGELQERNWHLIHSILDQAANSAVAGGSVERMVGDFFVSSMETNQIEQAAFSPLGVDLKRIDSLANREELPGLLADFHRRDVGAMFNISVDADAKNSSVYTFQMGQGGLGLPDRDYYLKESFTKQREAYLTHIAKMLILSGEDPHEAASQARLVFGIEKALAESSKSRVNLRDPVANYHKFPVAKAVADYPALHLDRYLRELAPAPMNDLIIGQPEFFSGLEKLVKERPLNEWKIYLRWHLLRTSAPYLHAAAENESFAFYGTVLRGQPAQEPRWQRVSRVIDSKIGEALGKIFIEKHFPPTARARMAELIGNLKAVFRDRLQKLDWMTEATRAKAIVKFERFTEKIGHPENFRDYSSVSISRNDYFGNVQRAAIFESRRQLARVGKPVDKAEWHMTPQTVNAYFNPLQNEIVFPAGILQPPFFDVEMDDAVNYGAIGMVIGHEITHGYDDEGRKYDADGNLNEWWTEADAKAFEDRAQKVVAQFDGYQALPGLSVNGKLTLGENIADLGGTSIAFEALQRALTKDPSKRRRIDGFTPEQRFFLSASQVWRINCREAEARRLITVDPHSPGQFRAIGAHVNMPEFFSAFGIQPGAAMWRAPELRAKIW
jgi:putative endopeptidase